MNALGDFDLVIDGIAGAKTVKAAATYVGHLSRSLKKPAWDRTKAATLLAAEQAILKHYGMYHGYIDGYDGQLTTDARIKYAASDWRDMIDGLTPPVLPSTLKWPKYTTYEQMCEVFGEPGEKLIHMDTPFPMVLAWDKKLTINRFSINSMVADSAHKALEEIADTYSDTERHDLGFTLFGGCFNDRPMRGSTKKSTHAWGIAIDFDPEHNQLRWDHKKAKLAKPNCDAFWKAWERQGWVSLGRERDYDWMHVQACNI